MGAGLGTRSNDSSSLPSPWPRRFALLLACAGLCVAGCAHVGKLSLPEQKTLSPVQPRTTPQSEHSVEAAPARMAPLMAVGDTVLGFIPGTADSSRRYLRRLLRGHHPHTLNIVVYRDNPPGEPATAPAPP